MEQCDARTDPIHIAIDARPFSGPTCGYTIYLESIIECLRHSGMKLTLLTNREIFWKFDDIPGLEVKVFGKLNGFKWEQVSLVKHLMKNRYDIYFSGANRGIPLKKITGTRLILGLLDIIPYLFARDYFLSRWKELVLNPKKNEEMVAQLIAVARADAILTISQQSARDIKRVFRRRGVTPLLIRLKDITHRNSEHPKKQFVYVGGTDARKKVGVLLRAFAMFCVIHRDYRLILIGSDYTSIDPLIQELELSDNIVLTGYVDHDEKFRIMSESMAMVYPSVYEGYGLAIAEGFQAGIPVVAGYGGSQAEVGGNGARLIDPCDAAAIADAMQEMTDPAMRAIWIERGREQLARLTDPAIETATVAWFAEQARLARMSNAGRSNPTK